MVINIDEQRLATLCSERNRQAEDELYSKYAARVFALCLRYSDNQEDARDLLQETFIKVFEKIDTFTYRGEGSLAAWISRIAVNVALNEVRRQRFRFLSFDTFLSETVEDPPEEQISAIPEEVLIRMISELNATKRAVFNMYCIDGYSHKEIAKELGISEKGSAAILSRAKVILKKRIIKYIKSTERK